MLVAWVGRFDRIRPSAHLQDQLDDFFKRRVGNMGHVPAAETNVVTHPVLRNTVERMVERVDS